MKTVSFLASGRGSNFAAVARQIQSGQLNARPGVLVTSNKHAGAIALAQSLNFPVHPLSWKEEGGQQGFEAKTRRILEEHGSELVVCAGYMKILSSDFVRAFSGRIINIHPSLLPAFPGLHAQQQAITYGVKVSGCSVHFVEEGVDSGPIILQQTVNVSPDDNEQSLADRILEQEHPTLCQAVRLFCQDRLQIRGRQVHITP